MQKSTELAAAITDRLGITDRVRAAIEKLAATLDEKFPAVVIAPRGGEIAEPADGYLMGAGKPDFVRADDEGWA